MNIKTPVRLDHWGDITADNGELLATGYGPRRVDEMKEIVAALNAHEALVAERDALKVQRDLLWYALMRAEQTFRNLASDGSIVTMGTSLEIARNELQNMRDALKQGEQ